MEIQLTKSSVLFYKQIIVTKNNIKNLYFTEKFNEFKKTSIEILSHEKKVLEIF